MNDPMTKHFYNSMASLKERLDIIISVETSINENNI